jgi:hypothetical protein
MLALYVHPEGETAVRLWEVARRGFHHNQRLRREVVASFRPIEIETPEGIIIGEGTGFEWDRASHDATIQKFTRGLYWHHYGEMLPPDTPIEVTLVHEFPQHLLEMLGQQPVHMIGDQQFVYKFRRVDDDPSVSVWLQAFYGRHLTYVTTGDLPQ